MTETKQTLLQKLVNEFLEYCEIERNKSHNTITTYAHLLSRFAEFAKNQGIEKPEDISLEVVRSFRLELNRLTDEHGNRLKLITQNYHVIALRAFLKYLTKRDFKTLAPEKIELAKNPSREVHPLENDELERMIDAAKKEGNELMRLRDLALMHTLFSSGLRISELASLKKQQVNLERGEFTVRGKGDKLRMTFLSPEAIDAIKIYLKKRNDNHPALFISHSKVGNSVTKEIEAISKDKVTGSRLQVLGLTPRSIQRLIHKYAMLAGIPKDVTPHTFRHSFATDLLRNGADIRSVQSLLGHASITTTQIYTHVTNQGLRDIHKKYHNKKD